VSGNDERVEVLVRIDGEIAAEEPVRRGALSLWQCPTQTNLLIPPYQKPQEYSRKDSS